ncbi:hypothetical protein [Chryseosolibacter indicus]|uniref:TPM domain-containing protein n=1 Tax=Chryseosolibacter indicus TaxID=2782351 RepID=A0ABS5VSV4_9BACT|nr:hypothetical protein [Chryseosolibacter indicus]MBT1703081.1 hypothetical protein [Chryseosolibacter indicus]
MKLFSIVLIFASLNAFAQLPTTEQQFLSRLKPGGPLPEKLLMTKSVVFYPYEMTTKELESIQRSFQRTGIDAVVYYENDLVSAGRDVSVNLAEYLNSREIANLIYLQKEGEYIIYITEYNKKANLVEQDQATFIAKNTALDALLQSIYIAAVNGLKSENFLINDYPELGNTVKAIDGRRNEFFAIDLKVDPLAVPKFGDEAMDKELEEIMKQYPFKYQLTEANLSEVELRKKGFLYVLRFVCSRNKVASNVLEYPMSKSQNAIVSMTYNGGAPEIKNISADAAVYKFYFKHLESRNVFLGTKWDADTSWQQALINQIRGFRMEFKIQ